jgi:hypothetical protein
MEMMPGDVLLVASDGLRETEAESPALMDEYKANNLETRRLLLRLLFPHMRPLKTGQIQTSIQTIRCIIHSKRLRA